MEHKIRQYAIYHSNQKLAVQVLKQLRKYKIQCEHHISRTRFSLEESHPLHSYIALVCVDVTDEINSATGERADGTFTRIGSLWEKNYRAKN